jgi:hypothetical protein
MATRDRDQRTLRPANTQPARLPPIPRHGADAQTDKALDAIREHLEVREGSRGNPWEKAVTERRLSQMGLVDASLAPGSSSPSIVTMGTATGTVMLRTPDGRYVSASLDTVAQALRQTKLYKDLQRRIDDVARFDDFDAKVRALILPELDQIAAERGADIRRTEQKLQTATESFAATVTEVTAAVQGAMAGVRQTLFATANDGRATAGAVTQVTARLDGFDGGAATVEEVMTAIADRTTGLAAEYYVKVSAGKAIASIGLAASEDPGGSTLSSIILQADALAIAPAYDYSQTGTPSATAAGETWYNTATDVSYRSTAAGTGSWVVFTPTIPFTFDTTTGNATISGDLMVGGTITSSGIYLASGNFQVDALTGAVQAYSFNGSNSTFSNSPNPALPALTATSSVNGLGPESPAIKAVAAAGGHAIEAVGSISVNLTGSGIDGVVAQASGAAGYAVNATHTGTGIASGAAVFGRTDGAGTGVYGYGPNAGGYGVFGEAGSTGVGVYAKNTGGGNALYSNGPAYISGVLTAAAGIAGNLTGGVTGNVTGNISGSSGSCTGNAATATSATYATRSGEVYNSGNVAMYCGSGTYYCMLQTADANLVVYNASAVAQWSWLYGPSDRRLKKHVRATHAIGLEAVNALRVVDFKWKVGAGRNDTRRHTGFIAQEVADVIPTAVGDIGDIKGVNSDALIPFLVKAVQELAAKVALLEARP